MVWAELLSWARAGGKKDLEGAKVCSLPAGRMVLCPQRWQKQQKEFCARWTMTPPPPAAPVHVHLEAQDGTLWGRRIFTAVMMLRISDKIILE